MSYISLGGDPGIIDALNDTVTLTLAGQSTVGVGISGTWVGTLVAEVSQDNSQWDMLPLVEPLIGLRDPSVTFNGNFQVNTGAQAFVRIRASLWTSGTANIRLYAPDSTYEFREHYGGVFHDSHVVSVTQTDTVNLTNYISRGIEVFLSVTALTGGPVARPNIQIGYIQDGIFLPVLANYTKAGDISAPELISIQIAPGASGGGWDHIEPCAIGRKPVIKTFWVLPGATTVTTKTIVNFLL